jgi:hypothetical protein
MMMLYSDVHRGSSEGKPRRTGTLQKLSRNAHADSGMHCDGSCDAESLSV